MSNFLTENVILSKDETDNTMLYIVFDKIFFENSLKEKNTDAEYKMHDHITPDKPCPLHGFLTL